MCIIRQNYIVDQTFVLVGLVILTEASVGLDVSNVTLAAIEICDYSNCGSDQKTSGESMDY
jgi:hypothetical protein